jgi:transcriptional regulator with XRE-family HTH domain
MDPISALRARARVSQAELARRAGTSQPTIAAYEAGRKSPTIRTIGRLATALGYEHAVRFVPPLTREDRRSLVLHHALAARLARAPDEVLRRASENVRRMVAARPEAVELLAEWQRILARPVDDVIDAMTDPGARARDLRQVTPFAGVLSGPERADVYRRFREMEVIAA